MECRQKKTNCMFYGEGRCRILSDTEFDRVCPFFKKGKDPYAVERIVEGHEGVFRKVCGYGERYYVSDLGEVMIGGGRFIKGRKGGRNSVVVELAYEYNGKKVTTLKPIHNLVADAFMLEGDGEIEHIDGDPSNNRLDNLRRKTNGK